MALKRTAKMTRVFIPATLPRPARRRKHGLAKNLQFISPPEAVWTTRAGHNPLTLKAMRNLLTGYSQLIHRQRFIEFFH
jgi:hypothetical protein